MKNNNTSINEIRPKKDLCIKGLWIEIILACAFILSSILIDLTLLSFVFIMPILILFTCLDYKNTCVVYDQNGITITNFMNRHFYYSWDDVISVQDTYADPRLFKGATDSNQRRILKIGVRNHKGKIEYLTYLFWHFSGIYQFLEYYEYIRNNDQN